MPAWRPTFGGPAQQPNNTVRALAVYDDGLGGGPALYAGGSFSSMGGVAAFGIAKWYGSSWSPLRAGLNGGCYALAVHDDGSGSGPALFAAGTFSSAGGAPANRVAKWDGTAWSPLGSGLGQGSGQEVRALAVFDDGSGGGPALYAGGHFTANSGSPAKYVARWDGNSWTPLGTELTAGLVHALAVHDDGSGPALYVGGNTIYPTGVPVPDDNCIARWDGSSWSAVGAGVIAGYPLDGIMSMVEHDDGGSSGTALYVGGWLHPSFGSSIVMVGRWNGSTWATVGGGMDFRVWTLAVFDDGSGAGEALYAGGDFTIAGGNPANRVAKWDGSSWSALGAGVDASVWVMSDWDSGTGGAPLLVAGGDFGQSPAGDVRIAAWGCASGEPGSAFCYGDGSGTPCPCSNPGAAERGCANSTGAGAQLLAQGSSSTIVDDLWFHAEGLIANQSALLFAGHQAAGGGAGIAFGDGLRCASVSVRRLGVRAASPGGAAEWGPGLAGQGGWQPGHTRRFQVWYRDPSASPCGSGFNLTNGYEVAFSH